ncbi:DUF3054 domain-containing protein [Halovivax cerinus]|uniref:DUF3054 domain-containing protein n=1 Tax=Halovivax cerinus TaxID=1487865 RepID=A0ABD5NR93_9EURY|nr:DUF3054 domain-containing protein [Halovivax cerinus]
MNDSHTLARRWAALEPFVPLVTVGDGVVVTAFIAFGLWTHGIEPWTVPGYTLRTAAPFVIGWLLVTPVVGTYRDRTWSSFRRSAAVVGVTWLGATLLGGAIRSTALVPGAAPPSFLLVNAALGLVFVVPWRVFVTAATRRRRRRARQPATTSAD